MSNVGVLFEIPNEYGNYLADLLEPIQFTLYQWEVYYDEIHLIEDNKFTDDSLFNEEAKIMDGQQLYDIAKKNTYYLIFASLIAYVGDENTKFIRYYQDFLDSNCEIVIGVSDCSYVMYWTKDSEVATRIYNYALSKNYKNVRFVSDEAIEIGNYQIC